MVTRMINRPHIRIQVKQYKQHRFFIALKLL